MHVAHRCLFTTLLLVAGCDAPPPAPRVEVHDANPSGDRKGLSECLDECSAQRLSATDAATCRNNCETAFKVAPTAGGEPALDAAVKCLDRCHRQSPGDPACVDECKQSASSVEAAFPGAVDRLGSCVDACHADRSLNDTDRWTCLNNCSQTAKIADKPAAAQ
ncbi:hypothetical protein [Nannocystis punicea]|uniref:Ferredoxin n=1 Tax=Nannocystis punicea TaxID=2995304 RepID=A0ABY7GRX0_9BACT|nr:hypothetical protein [Nannocystis poenicansa]WAS89692.1 hypothetical protein O0S08_26155 [Nannocystis poenicansa]